MTTTCAWLDDRCDRPAVGDTAHPVFGVVPICKTHQASAGAPLITTYDQES